VVNRSTGYVGVTLPAQMVYTDCWDQSDQITDDTASRTDYQQTAIIDGLPLSFFRVYFYTAGSKNSIAATPAGDVSMYDRAKDRGHRHRSGPGQPSTSLHANASRSTVRRGDASLVEVRKSVAVTWSMTSSGSCLVVRRPALFPLLPDREIDDRRRSRGDGRE